MFVEYSSARSMFIGCIVEYEYINDASHIDCYFLKNLLTVSSDV